MRDRQSHLFTCLQGLIPEPPQTPLLLLGILCLHRHLKLSSLLQHTPAPYAIWPSTPVPWHQPDSGQLGNFSSVLCLSLQSVCIRVYPFICYFMTFITRVHVPQQGAKLPKVVTTSLLPSSPTSPLPFPQWRVRGFQSRSSLAVNKSNFC